MDRGEAGLIRDDWSDRAGRPLPVIANDECHGYYVCTATTFPV